MMDQELDKIKDEINTVKINTTAAHEHIGKIERFIQMIKEHSRAMVSDLPYSVLPQQVVIHLVYFAMLWLNSLPADKGVSEIYSLRKIASAVSLASPSTALHPLALTSRLLTTRQSQIPCVSALSHEYSLAPRGIIRGPTRSLTSILVWLRNLTQSPSYPCQTGLSRWLMIRANVTQRRTQTFPHISKLQETTLQLG
jgi:hypothetical protein